MGKKSPPAPPPPPPMPPMYTPQTMEKETEVRRAEEKRMDEEIVVERKKILNKAKKGRYSLLRTGGEGLLDEAPTKKRSLLGSGT
jgi:hypothetical protein